MSVAESYAEVSDGLGCPGSGGVGGDSEKVHASCGVFDDEQDVKPPEYRGVDASELGSDNRLGLGANELRPGRSGAVACRVDTSGFEKLPDC